MQPALRYRQLPPSSRAHIALNPALWARIPLRRHLDVTGAARVHRHRRRRCQRPACCLSRSCAWLQSSLWRFSARASPPRPGACCSLQPGPCIASPTSPAHESQPAPVRAPSPSMTAARTLSQPHPLLAQAHPVQRLGPGAQPSRPRTHINQDPTSCACNPSPPAHRTHSSHLLPGLFPPLPRC